MNTSNKAFEEWFNSVDWRMNTDEYCAAQKAWNASRNNTIDEAFKVVKSEHTPNCDHAANKIKELKD